MSPGRIAPTDCVVDESLPYAERKAIEVNKVAGAQTIAIIRNEGRTRA